MTLTIDIAHQYGPFTLKLAFDTHPGITALFGRSGAGKTTAIKAIAGLMRPDTGRITLNDEVLLDTAENIYVSPAKRRMGTVFQDARLFPHLSVTDNLTFGVRYAPKGAQGPNFDDVVTLLGVEHLLSRSAATLSGGEKQRVALGRALLSKPRMLLMDEPLASLDGPRKQEILPYLERLRDGAFQIPILYVSHAVDEIARLADMVVLLQHGHVATQGPLFEVMANPTAVPLLGVREAGAVIEATVIAHASDGLSTLKISGGTLELPGVQAPTGSTVRLRVLAQDVILSRKRPEGLSSVNVLPVTVTAIQHGDGPGAAIGLDAGNDRLLARVTGRAVGELGLETGTQCFAILKATTVAPGNIGR